MFAALALPLGASDGLAMRMNAFAASYRDFAGQYNAGFFDVKLARKLSREWKAVEAGGEWPR